MGNAFIHQLEHTRNWQANKFAVLTAHAIHFMPVSLVALQPVRLQ